MAYFGRFKPKNPSKYNGDINGIWYRSSYECKLMSRFDSDDSFLSWSSEEIIIPYFSTIENKWRRYFPDFLVTYKTKNNEIKTMMVEVKPYAQTLAPKKPKKQTKRYITEVTTYCINQDKWKQARKYCEAKGYEFQIMTEKEIFGSK